MFGQISQIIFKIPKIMLHTDHDGPAIGHDAENNSSDKVQTC